MYVEVIEKPSSAVGIGLDKMQWEKKMTNFQWGNQCKIPFRPISISFLIRWKSAL